MQAKFDLSILLHFPVFGSCHCTPRFALGRRIALCKEENSEKKGKKRSKRGLKPACMTQREQYDLSNNTFFGQEVNPYKSTHLKFFSAA